MKVRIRNSRSAAADSPETSYTFPFVEPKNPVLCLMMALDYLTAGGYYEANRALAREWLNRALFLMTGKQLEDFRGE